MINIGIVDDHILLRKGIIELLSNESEINISLEASDGLDLFNKLNSKDYIVPDVILLDINMPNQNGFESLIILKENYPATHVIILTMYDESPYIIKALKNGAKGFVLKSAKPNELISAIKTVHNNEVFINDHLTSSLLKNLKNSKAKRSNALIYNLTLSRIEEEVLEYICNGLTNQEIASKIYKSKRTAEGYRQKLLDKTNNKNTAALVAWAFRNGYVE